MKYCPNSSVNMHQKEDQRERDPDQQNGSLNKICPEYGFQSACVRVNDCNDAHDDNQYVYVDSGQASQHHTGQVHDN